MAEPCTTSALALMTAGCGPRRLENVATASSNRIETVTGPIQPEALGMTFLTPEQREK